MSQELDWVENMAPMLEYFGLSLYQCGVVGEVLYKMAQDMAEFKGVSTDRGAELIGAKQIKGEAESYKNLGIALKESDICHKD